MNTRQIAPLAAVALTFGALSQAAPAQPAPAATLTGDWKASLAVGGATLRLVLHVTPAQSGHSASLDSVDQAALGLPVDSIRIDPAHLHFEMSKLSARYDGDWNPATLQFEGQWQQAANRLPLNWRHAGAAAAGNLPLSEEDRDYLLTYLKKTEDDLLRSIAKLTPAQWTYQSDPSRWSIAECVEHLVLEEQTLFPAINQVVRIPLPGNQARSTRAEDQRIVQYMTGRTQKVSAAESVNPRGSLGSPEEGAAQFSKVREETIAWVRTTAVDLRGHGTANPTFHFLDAYGYFLVLAAHSARHTAQIEEVKTAPGYPK